MLKLKHSIYIWSCRIFLYLA